MSHAKQFGFFVDAEGNKETVTGGEAVLENGAKANAFQWVDLENPEPIELHQIAKLFNLHEDAVDDALSGEQRPRIDEFDNHACIVLYGALGPDSKTEFSPRKLFIFIARDHLVTVHAEPLATINYLKRRVEKSINRTELQKSDRILHTIIDGIVDNYLSVSEDYQQRLDALEEQSLSDQPPETLLAEVLSLRRDMLGLRRLAGSLREVLHPLVAGELDFVSDNIATDFIHVRDHLTLSIETIDNLRELLNGVRDNYHASLALKANNIMQTLTIFASLFLPLSLVAGIYGMNTPLWPSVDNISSFWVIIGFMATTITIMLGLFKRNGWF